VPTDARRNVAGRLFPEAARPLRRAGRDLKSTNLAGAQERHGDIGRKS
jgi:hypothetical protein